jgi:HEAT repeat protein
VLNKVAAPRVLEPIIEALGRIGDTQAAKPLSEFLFLKDSSLAIQAVFALARICSDQSIAYVTNAIGRDQDIDLAIISACTELDPEKRVNILTLALHRAHPLARDRAEAALEDMGSVALSAMHHSLGHVPIEAQLRILNVLGRLQDRRSLIPLRKLLHSHPEEEIRIAAYQVLDKMALPQDSYILVRGLYDSSEKVRLSAAHAVDRNAGPNMLSGIKNLLQDEDAQNQHILQALLRAKALNVLSYLWTIKTFRQKILLAADSCSDQSVHELVQSLSSKTM